MNLVLIETSGNQQYIFSTNKLRENVGASELTYRAGTQWVLEAVKDVSKQESLWREDSEELRQTLRDPSLNPKVEDGAEVEVIVATSGKALLLVKHSESARQIVQSVTLKALEYAPGIDVFGVIRDFDWNRETVGTAIKEVHEEFEAVRANRPGPQMRFLRLPIIAECATSGFPASRLVKISAQSSEAKSEVSIVKGEWRQAYENRMQRLVRRDADLAGVSFAENVGRLEEDCDWLAVVHADGNGLGEIFLKFGRHAGCEDASQNRAFVDTFRGFSLALDACTEQAFLTALKTLLKRTPDAWFKLPILPIVLGGDDLTIVCDGKAALQFTYDFLSEFEAQTEVTDRAHYGDIIPHIAKVALGAPRLSACAGIAIIKPHFPFSSAYDLAEELIKSAKQVKMRVKSPEAHQSGQRPWPCSAIDFHALYDSTASELDQIRVELVKDGGSTKLYARPYVITDPSRLEGASDNNGWAEAHCWKKLERRVEAILMTDENDEQRRSIPNRQLHDLRAGLFLGKKAANARYDLISHRYEDDGRAALTTFEEEGGDSLFFRDSDGLDATRLLDAMEAANFWVTEESKKGAAVK